MGLKAPQTSCDAIQSAPILAAGDRAECTLTSRCALGLLWGMIADAPVPGTPSHVIGESYDFAAIRESLGGQPLPPNFVIHREGAVLGLCLGLMWNPLAEADPAEVWVGRKGDLPGWGVKLAATTVPLPVYVRREEGGKWFYTGRFLVTGSSTEPDAIKQRLKPPVITGISRIVFLRRVAEGQG